MDRHEPEWMEKQRTTPRMKLTIKDRIYYGFLALWDILLFMPDEIDPELLAFEIPEQFPFLNIATDEIYYADLEHAKDRIKAYATLQGMDIKDNIDRGDYFYKLTYEKD